MKEQAPSTTVIPKPNEPGWDVTYLDAQGRVTRTARITTKMIHDAGGMGNALVTESGALDRTVQPKGVVCSSCGRGYGVFVAEHRPEACAVAHDDKLSGPSVYAANAGQRRGPVKVLPRDRRLRHTREVRRDMGLL